MYYHDFAWCKENALPCKMHAAKGDLLSLRRVVKAVALCLMQPNQPHSTKDVTASKTHSCKRVSSQKWNISNSSTWRKFTQQQQQQQQQDIFKDCHKSKWGENQGITQQLYNVNWYFKLKPTGVNRPAGLGLALCSYLISLRWLASNKQWDLQSQRHWRRNF